MMTQAGARKGLEEGARVAGLMIEHRGWLFLAQRRGGAERGSSALKSAALFATYGLGYYPGVRGCGERDWDSFVGGGDCGTSRSWAWASRDGVRSRSGTRAAETRSKGRAAATNCDRVRRCSFRRKLPCGPGRVRSGHRGAEIRRDGYGSAPETDSNLSASDRTQARVSLKLRRGGHARRHYPGSKWARRIVASESSAEPCSPSQRLRASARALSPTVATNVTRGSWSRTGSTTPSSPPSASRKEE